MKYDRIILMVLDGVGAGALPDAAEYGDTGENAPHTLVNVARAVGGLTLPTFQRLGLGNLLSLEGVAPVSEPEGWYGLLTEVSKGKDSVTGHWEMMGIITSEPFPTYPNGFPPEVMEAFESAIGTRTLGNYPASGTEIIKQLGEEHARTGYPIVYTSADSVFQIAAHEAVIPVDRLYWMCQQARDLLVPPHHVQRVIARPFIGESRETFTRTKLRKDFPLAPPPNVLDDLAAAGIATYGIGVIPELFTYRGFVEAERTQSNPKHWEALDRALQSDSPFIFANFEDFDMLYGHRNDAPGFAKALEEFDERLAEMLGCLERNDLVLLTADHGNDPTTPSTDHSREFVPLIGYSPRSLGGSFGTRSTFADLGATIASNFGVSALRNGTPIQPLFEP